MSRPRKPANPFRYFRSSPEIIRLAVLMYVRFSLSLRKALSCLDGALRSRMIFGDLTSSGAVMSPAFECGF